MMPNLSGVSFKDALKALIKTPPPMKREKIWLLQPHTFSQFKIRPLRAF